MNNSLAIAIVKNENTEKYFTKEERKLLLELICNEQVHMIIKDHTKYQSDKYKKLEELKIKVNSLEVKKSCETCACKDCASNDDTYDPCANCKNCSKTDGFERWMDKSAECFCKE